MMFCENCVPWVAPFLENFKKLTDKLEHGDANSCKLFAWCGVFYTY
jgi:hypothetical protein